MAKGKFIATVGHKQTVVEGETPLDARFAVRDELDPFCEYPLELIELRLVSGFPEFTAGELRFGEEVLPGDSFPDQYNITETIIRNANDLQGVVRSWPPGTAAVPPFRAHANSAGSWKIPSFAETRRAVREAALGSIGDDRRKGRNCE
jgi:hypothetical protein